MRKKFFLIIASVFFMHSLMSQETSIGIKGGLNLTFFKVHEAGFGQTPASQTGYYFGLFSEIPSNTGFSIQPEILYIGINDFKFLNLPIYAKYEVANNLHFMAGPSLNYFFDFFTNQLKVGADISTSYDITTAFDIHIKFALGFDEISPNGLFFGIGYKI